MALPSFFEWLAAEARIVDPVRRAELWNQSVQSLEAMRQQKRQQAAARRAATMAQKSQPVVLSMDPSSSPEEDQWPSWAVPRPYQGSLRSTRSLQSPDRSQKSTEIWV
jgi:hypothetical protein